MGRSLVRLLRVIVFAAALPAAAHPPVHPVAEKPAITPSMKLRGFTFDTALNYDDGLFEDLSDFVVSTVTIQQGFHAGEPDFHAKFFQVDMSEVGAIADTNPDGITGTIARAGFGPRRTVNFQFKNPFEIYRHEQCEPCFQFKVLVEIDEANSVSASDIAEALGKLPVIGELVGLAPGKLLDKLIGDLISSRTPVYRYEFTLPCSLKDEDTPFYATQSNPPFFGNDDPIERDRVDNFQKENGSPGMNGLTVKFNLDVDEAAAGTTADGRCPTGLPPDPPPPGDKDGDSVPNAVDNCPDTPNLPQSDLDTDGFGDDCDVDDDGDDATDDVEKLPFVQSNPFSQASRPENGIHGHGSCTNGLDDDGDGLFDLLDPSCDSDHDSVPDPLDNCLVVENPGQADGDFDGTGDACEDPDEDTFGDAVDNCPLVDNIDQRDLDFDGLGDACDPDDDGDGVPDGGDVCGSFPDPAQLDGDGDGVGDACDDCPAVPDADQADADGDGAGDVCDANPYNRIEAPALSLPALAGLAAILAFAGARRLRR